MRNQPMADAWLNPAGPHWTDQRCWDQIVGSAQCLVDMVFDEKRLPTTEVNELAVQVLSSFCQAVM